MGRIVAAIIMLLSMAGCASIQGGPAINLNFAPSEDVDKCKKDLANTTDYNFRNRCLNFHLAEIDVEYSKFRQNLASNKKNSAAITSLLLLMADVAGGLTNSIGVKDNYLALSALVGGGQLVYDKNYLYEQTISALITQMDANRSRKLLEIRQAMLETSLVDYSGQVAIGDLLQYHHAGTLLGAITAIQIRAGSEDRDNTQELRMLTRSTPAQRDESRSNNVRLEKLITMLDEKSKPALTKYLTQNNVTLSKSPTLEELRNGLRDVRLNKYRDDFDGMVKSLQQAGLTVPN
ncbi:hypothetical protein [Pseudoxanthomonas mexicana]